MVMEAHQMDNHPHSLDTHQTGRPLDARTLEAHQLEKGSLNDGQIREPNPTPECVGLEFVRQYYTILNKAPWHLHRFYASNSSFMHSGENSNRQAVIGQGEIHKNIMGLDFADCHAKILLIDSQSTLAHGIVIQVTGELSNRGSPMRRFMQTFVLAPQSEKKYYVHNDIFRYQDQVFNDDSSSQVDECSDEAEEVVQEEPEVVRPHVNGTAVSPAVVAAPSSPAMQPPVVQPSPPMQQQSPAAPPKVQQATVSPPQIASPPRPVEVVQTPAPVNNTPQQPPKQPETWNSDWNEPAVQAATEWTPEPVVTETPPQSSKRTQVTPPPKPEKKPSTSSVSAPAQAKSYAGFFKDTSSSTASPMACAAIAPREVTPRAIPQPTQQQAPPKQEKTSPPPGEQAFQRAGRVGRGPNYRNRNTHFSESEDGESVSADGYGEVGPRRRSSPPDAHQIFVGNLPLTIKEDDLKKTFEKYGTIVDVRINIGKGKMAPAQNGNSKNPGNHTVPNFGFVTFSDDAAVAKCLQSRPIAILGDHRLNVEEKKTKSKVENFGPRPQGMRNSMGGRGGGGGGFSRSEGGGRGGQRGGYNSANNRQR